MLAEASKYFKYLALVREDIREEFDVLGIQEENLKICDFGCGNGLTTFGLALETKGSDCIGVDLFNEESTFSPTKISQFIEIVRGECKNDSNEKNKFPLELCKLVENNQSPHFRKANIVLNQDMPKDIDLAYCKKVLINLKGKQYNDIPSGEKGLRIGLRNIAQSIRPRGLFCVIEYDREFELGKYIEENHFRILKRDQIQRREIRSRGRTTAISTFSLYLCQKSK
jgi:SAM-dependent methyltransferase